MSNSSVKNIPLYTSKKTEKLKKDNKKENDQKENIAYQDHHIKTTKSRIPGSLTSLV